MQTSEIFTPQDANFYHDTIQGHETVLVADTEYIINPDKPLAQEEGYNVTAVIDGYDGDEATRRYWEADGKVPDQFLILDLRSAPKYGKYKDFMGLAINSDIDYMIIGDNFDPNTKSGFKGVRRGENVVMGRNDDTKNRFNMSDTSSRKHFSVNLSEDGELSVTDLHSSNGTRVKTIDTPIMNGMAPRSRYESYKVTRNLEQQPIVNEEQLPPKSNAELWAESRGEVYATMTDGVKQMFDRVESSFIHEIPISTAAEVLTEIDRLRTAGNTQKQIRIAMIKKWHPDAHPNASPAHKAVALSVTKMLGQVL